MTFKFILVGAVALMLLGGCASQIPAVPNYDYMGTIVRWKQANNFELDNGQIYTLQADSNAVGSHLFKNKYGQIKLVK